MGSIWHGWAHAKEGGVMTSTGDIKQYQAMVCSIAYKMYSNQAQGKLEVDDLIQYGFIGLINGLSHLDRNRSKEEQISYLYNKIRFGVLEGMRYEGIVKPRSTCKMTEYSTEAYDPIDINNFCKN